MRGLQSSNKSYRCFEWDIKDKIEKAPENTFVYPQKTSKKHSSKVLQKLKHEDYDQKEVEDKYRNIGDAKFKFNPHSFSVDCQHNAFIIHRNLLDLNGCDEILVNNTTFFDEVNQRIQFKHDLLVSKQENSRIKHEKYRAMAEKFRLGKAKSFLKVNSIYKDRKFSAKLSGKVSKDCERFFYGSRRRSFDSMYGDCERFEYNTCDLPIRKIDSLDGDNSLMLTYEKAERFIKDKLLKAPEEEIKPVFLPIELRLSKYYDTKVSSKEASKGGSKKNVEVKKTSFITKTTNLKSCFCSPKKR